MYIRHSEDFWTSYVLSIYFSGVNSSGLWSLFCQKTLMFRGDFEFCLSNLDSMFSNSSNENKIIFSFCLEYGKSGKQLY